MSTFKARFIALLVPCVAVFAFSASPASAASAWWRLEQSSTPTVLTPGAEAQVILEASNVGDAQSAPGTQVAMSLPSWLTVTHLFGVAGQRIPKQEYGAFGAMNCSAPASLTCVYPNALPAYATVEMYATVKVAGDAPASGVSNATLEEPGARPVTLTHDLSTGPSTPFGLEDYELTPESEGGGIDTQAGSHPFQLTSVLTLNDEIEPQPIPGLFLAQTPALAKDLRFKLPQGLVGNANLLPHCSEELFSTRSEGGLDQCPADTAVGVALITVNEPEVLGFTTVPVPVFNLTPSPGEPARFGFQVEGVSAVLDTSVRTGSDYGVTVSVSNTTEIADFLKSEVIFWGSPGEASHDASRGWSCIDGGYWVGQGGAPSEPCDEHEASPRAFLTLPSSCGSFQSEAEANSWSDPSVFAQAPPFTLRDAGGKELQMTGCSRQPFDPSLAIAPDVQSASSPSGLTVNVHVPQEQSLTANGLAEADVKGLTVPLPAGVVLNPSAADGLQACPLLTGSEPAKEAQEEMGELAGIDLESRQPANCPDASKVATVTVTTPLLPNPLTGFVYLATPAPNGELGLNPFNSLLALYLVVRDPVSGVLIKVPMQVTANPITGQLTATQSLPELPFENAELHFFGGERAPLGTPAFCRDDTAEHPGDYSTESSFAPWTEGSAFVADSGFQITSGPNGGACPGGALPFGPSLTAGATNVNAGAFTPLTTTITRQDGQQNIRQVQLHFPPGLSGVLTGVKLCGEAEANAGTCGPESLVGETIVSVGLGGDPFSVTGGKVYITGPYHGAPFGLSIVNPAVAGPFNLGKVIVRGKLELDRQTAALTFTSNSEAEGYAIPHILDGIPLQIKHINVTINRGGGEGDFTFNPTNCHPQAITGTVNGEEGASSPIQSPFQATNCKNLQFAPKFAVSTPGRTTKAIGAGLHVKLSYPTAPFGSQANIAKVKVDLPKQLPSQLKTLQKACPAKTFEEGFEQCLKTAPHSKIGEAIVHTPLLPVPLKGPAIFVSHGGEAFPSLTIVLQGYGVTVDLVGSTFIHAGITSTTFKTVPDLPFSTFELTLSQGQYAALNTNLPEKDKGNLCGQKLTMPTAFVAQNGQEIHESTAIGVSGCKKAKKSSKKKHKPAAKRRGK